MTKTTTEKKQPLSATSSLRETQLKRLAIVVGGLLLVYLGLAYLLAPLMWEGYADVHPAWEDAPRVTHTGDKHPGDPINVAIVGSELELKKVLLAAGWFPADPVTLKSSLEIAEATVLNRQYDTAPVSSLYLFGRKQDLSFQQPVGDNPRKRHHVRFWKYDKLSPDGRPVWVGSATYDERVGLSYTTGQITHHIDADVDAERDHLMSSLQQTGDIASEVTKPDFHTQLEGRNGGGDLWKTDGSLKVAITKLPSITKPLADDATSQPTSDDKLSK